MRSIEEIKEAISTGKACLGIEFGSTRIKAVLIDVDKAPIASGTYDWENRYENHIWTYSEEDIWNGLQGCYQDLTKDVEEKYGEKITKLAGIGFSAMMHGYLHLMRREICLCPSVHGETQLQERRLKNFQSCSSITFRSAGASRIFIRQS